ncbi:MAG: TIGR04282 family arsenosugar biosynthesis glycosyltransferase [Thermoanaerobaculia bacterium]
MPVPRTLVLFARAPEPGQVKTRLAPLLGADGAARLYRAFLEDAARAYGRAADWAPVLAADPAADHPLLQALFASPWRREDQVSGDLGARLTAAFRSEAARGARAILAVGSDHPALPHRLLLEAFRTVEDGRHAALIPAEDGGYCAVALSREVAPEGVFEEIPWSSPAVLEATLERLARLGASVSLLSTFYDVDRPEDVARLARDLASRDPGGEDFPAATAKALRELAAEAAL